MWICLGVGNRHGGTLLRVALLSQSVAAPCRLRARRSPWHAALSHGHRCELKARGKLDSSPGGIGNSRINLANAGRDHGG